MEALEYLMLFVALTSLVVMSVVFSYHYLVSSSNVSLNYLQLHLIFESIAMRPCSTIRVSYLVPKGVVLKFSSNEVSVVGAVLECSLVEKYDLNGLVVEATESYVRYKLTFSSLELRGGYVYELLIRSEPSRIVITVISYRRA